MLAATPGRRARHQMELVGQGAGWNAADQRRDTPFVLRPRTVPRADGLHCGGGSGSEVSLSQLLEHRLVELGLGEESLEPSVLPLELLESLRVICLHAAVLLSPAVPGRLGDLEMPADLFKCLSLSEEFLALGEFSDHLFGCVMSLFQRAVLLAPFWSIGLALGVDQFTGTLSIGLGEPSNWIVRPC